MNICGELRDGERSYETSQCIYAVSSMGVGNDTLTTGPLVRHRDSRPLCPSIYKWEFFFNFTNSHYNGVCLRETPDFTYCDSTSCSKLECVIPFKFSIVDVCMRGVIDVDPERKYKHKNFFPSKCNLSMVP